MRYDTIRWDSLLLLLDASYSHERPSLPFDLFECADIMKVTVTVIIAIIIIIRHSDCNHKLSKINLRKAKLNDPNTLYYCIICNDLDSQCGQNSDHKMRNDILYCGTVGAYLLVFKWESLIEACRYYDDATKQLQPNAADLWWSANFGQSKLQTPHCSGFAVIVHFMHRRYSMYFIFAEKMHLQYGLENGNNFEAWVVSIIEVIQKKNSFINTHKTPFFGSSL